MQVTERQIFWFPTSHCRNGTEVAYNLVQDVRENYIMQISFTLSF